jgi:hypothetical protein
MPFAANRSKACPQFAGRDVAVVMICSRLFYIDVCKITVTWLASGKRIPRRFAACERASARFRMRWIVDWGFGSRSIPDASPGTKGRLVANSQDRCVVRSCWLPRLCRAAHTMEAWRHGGMEAWRHGGMEARPAPTPEHRVTWHPPNVPLTASSNERVALLGRRCARDQCCLSGPHEAGKLVAGIIGAGDSPRTRRRLTCSAS